MLIPTWILLATTTLPPITSAQPSPFSHFALYKNTHFGPCPPTAPPTATTPTPDPGPITNNIENNLPNNASLSPSAFCDRFWNYTVLPSTPLPGAFSISYINTLTNIVVYTLYLLTAHAAYRKYNPESFPPKDDKKRPGLIASAKSALWWPLLIYAVAEILIWWISFGMVLAHPRASHPILSPLASIATVTLTLKWYVEVRREWYERVRWPTIALGVLQLVATGVALGLFRAFHGRAEHYRVDAGFDLGPFEGCDVGALLRDPTDNGYMIEVGSLPAFFAYGFWVGCVVMLWWKGFSVGMVTVCVMSLCALVVGLSAGSLIATAARKRDPIAWDERPECALVHVMVGVGYGYYDVKFASGRNTLEKLQSLFGVVY